MTTENTTKKTNEITYHVPEVKVKIGIDYIKIFMDGILHLRINKQGKNPLVIHSYKNTKNDYQIDYTFSEGPTTETTYENKIVWVAILTKLNECL
jgi:hypothetical protein